MPLQLEILENLRPPEGCLSAWQTGEMARRPGDQPLAQRQHALSCPRCSGLLDEAQRSLRAATYERAPDAALAQLHRPVLFLPLWGRGPVLGLGAAAALVLAVVLGPVSSGRNAGADVHVKGATALFATVLHRDGQISRDVALDEISTLASGDKLMIDVRGAGARWVALRGFEAGTWRTYFEGGMPADRRIPVAVGITDSAETRLRIALCDAPGRGCRDYTYRF
jgi:hypothetical protein